jgi:hypothetical protein
VPPAAPTNGPAVPPAAPTNGPAVPPAAPTNGPVNPPGPVPQSGAVFVPPPAATQQIPYTVVANEAAVENLPPGAYALVPGPNGLEVIQNAPEGFQNKAAGPPAVYCGDGIVNNGETCEPKLNPCCSADCQRYQLSTPCQVGVADTVCKKNRCVRNTAGTLGQLFTCSTVLPQLAKPVGKFIRGTVCQKINLKKPSKSKNYPVINDNLPNGTYFPVTDVKTNKARKLRFCDATGACTATF